MDFQKLLLGQLYMHLEKKIMIPYLTLSTTINSKWITVLNVKGKTMNLLHNIKYIHDLEVTKVFLNWTKKSLI